MQGSVWGPLCCTTTMDKIGQKSYSTGYPLYTYKGMVSIPPLGMVDDELTIAECGPDATLTNVVMNNFTESKKLRFGIKKCNKMHIGKSTLVCDEIRVHEDVGKTVLKDKYVGDILTVDGTNTETIKDRADKGFGIVNEILSILSEIPLGPYRTSVGLRLREAMLLNGILFNSEIWYNVKEEEEQRLSEVDEYLLRKILGVPSKTPKEALFLETGCIPVKFILKMRRLMYLHHILKRPNEELIKKFYEAQKCKLSKGDWVQTVNENLKDLEIKLDEKEISQMSKQKFKTAVKKKIRAAAYKFLIAKKESHSKMSGTEYEKLEIQNYLKSDSGLTNDLKKLLVNFRTRMYQVKQNFKNQYENTLCQLCKTEREDQQHLFMCPEIMKECEELANNVNIEYEDIFGTRAKQIDAVQLLAKIVETRERLIETQHNADQCTIQVR